MLKTIYINNKTELSLYPNKNYTIELIALDYNFSYAFKLYKENDITLYTNFDIIEPIGKSIFKKLIHRFTITDIYKLSVDYLIGCYITLEYCDKDLCIPKVKLSEIIDEDDRVIIEYQSQLIKNGLEIYNDTNKDFTIVLTDEYGEYEFILVDNDQLISIKENNYIFKPNTSLFINDYCFPLLKMNNTNLMLVSFARNANLTHENLETLGNCKYFINLEDTVSNNVIQLKKVTVNNIPPGEYSIQVIKYNINNTRINFTITSDTNEISQNCADIININNLFTFECDDDNDYLVCITPSNIQQTYDFQQLKQELGVKNMFFYNLNFTLTNMFHVNNNEVRLIQVKNLRDANDIITITPNINPERSGLTYGSIEYFQYTYKGKITSMNIKIVNEAPKQYVNVFDTQ